MHRNLSKSSVPVINWWGIVLLITTEQSILFQINKNLLSEFLRRSLMVLYNTGILSTYTWTSDPHGLNKGHGSKFHVGSQVRQKPEEDILAKTLWIQL